MKNCEFLSTPYICVSACECVCTRACVCTGNNCRHRGESDELEDIRPQFSSDGRGPTLVTAFS